MSPSTQFSAVLDATPDAMVIIADDGSIVHVNAQAERLFGYSRDELRARPVEELIPKRFRGAHPKHRTGYFHEPRPRPMGAAGIELYGLKKDGSEFPAEVSLSPIELDGQPYVIAAIRDGTARRRVEEKFRRLLEAAPDAMVIVDAAGRISLVNAQALALFGYDRRHLIGQPVEVLIPERYRAAHPGHRKGYFHEPRKRPMGAGGLALFGLRRDGTEFPAEISLSPLETEEGLLAITAIRDVTDRRKAEDERKRLYQAEEAVRMRDEFLSIASHELKTPLTALQMQIEGFSRLFARARPDELVTKGLGKLDTMERSCERLLSLVEQLLDLSRITGGRLTLNPAEVNLCELVTTVLAQFQDEFVQAGCTLQVDLPSTPIVGRMDPLRVEQIVTNLVSNAVKYGRGKPIEVRLSADENAATLAVRDHGIGIPPEHQARLFQKFERLVSDRHYGGFGLGLWIVNQLIQAHGGNIDVWSQPGAGSTFTVTLPLTDQPHAAQVATLVQTDESILVVDDDPLIRQTFAEVLADEGYVVKTAANGLEALHLLRSGVRPCMIILDLMMPGMDGIAFRAEQKKNNHIADIPVVVISAAGSLDKRAQALGACAYLKKPVSLKNLLKTIESFC